MPSAFGSLPAGAPANIVRLLAPPPGSRGYRIVLANLNPSNDTVGTGFVWIFTRRTPLGGEHGLGDGATVVKTVLSVANNDNNNAVGSPGVQNTQAGGAGGAGTVWGCESLILADGMEAVFANPASNGVQAVTTCYWRLCYIEIGRE
jgi:hypothetical protein